MASRNPDFAALSEAAYEAADDLIGHLETCFANECDTTKYLRKIYRIRREEALQAIRGKKK